MTLAFRVLPHTDTSQPPTGTIAFLPGGPGSNAGGGTLTTGLTANYDLLFMDPRGTGGSSAIDCPDVQTGSANITELRADFAACGAQLGDASDRYSSSDVALDLEDLRAHLGLEQLDLYGTSYGSVFSQAYAARFPERVHSAVLDSGLPATDSAAGWGLGYPRAWSEIAVRYCEKTPACAANHPAAADELTAFIHGLADHPIEGPGGDVVDQPEMVAMLSVIGPFPGNLDAYRLMNAIASHNEGQDEAILALSSFANLSRGDNGDPSGFSAGMNAAVGCTDGPLPWDPAASTAEKEQQLATAIDALPADAFEPFTKEAWMAWWQPEGCLDWPAPDRAEPVLPEGTTSIAVPALVLVGEQDNVVPNHVSRDLLNVFPNGIYAPIAGAVHSVIGWSECPQDLVTTFIETLNVDGNTCAPTPGPT